MANARLTLIGLYNYDSSLFEKLRLPEGVENEEFINALLLEYGDKPVIYTDFDFMKFSIGVWSLKYQTPLRRINEAIEAEYNPVHNYDRYEDYEDEEDNASKTSDEYTISAFNSETYQPDSLNGTESESNRKLKHKAHLYGNIGVTEASAMQRNTIDFYKSHNIYSIAAELFARELLLYIY